MNSLVLEHYGKYFGQNNRWDTDSENGNIVRDRAIRIVSIELDDVDISKYMTKYWPLITDQGEMFTDYFGHNGVCTIEFGAPVYDWIITELVHQPNHQYKALDLIVETSHSDLFDYKNDLQEIAEIENILKTNAHLFDQFTSLRNT